MREGLANSYNKDSPACITTYSSGDRELRSMRSGVLPNTNNGPTSGLNGVGTDGQRSSRFHGSRRTANGQCYRISGWRDDGWRHVLSCIITVAEFASCLFWPGGCLTGVAVDLEWAAVTGGRQLF
jgi:hypothetical protein